MVQNFTDAYNEYTAGLYQKYGRDITIWLRSHHRTGWIFAYKVGDMVHCFAISASDYRITTGEHHNLVAMFNQGPT